MAKIPNPKLQGNCLLPLRIWGGGEEKSKMDLFFLRECPLKIVFSRRMPFEVYFFLGNAFWDHFFPGEGPPRFFLFPLEGPPQIINGGPLLFLSCSCLALLPPCKKVIAAQTLANADLNMMLQTFHSLLHLLSDLSVTVLLWLVGRHDQWRIYEGAPPARPPLLESNFQILKAEITLPPPLPTNRENLKISAPPYAISWIRHCVAVFKSRSRAKLQHRKLQCRLWQHDFQESASMTSL